VTCSPPGAPGFHVPEVALAEHVEVAVRVDSADRGGVHPAGGIVPSVLAPAPDMTLHVALALAALAAALLLLAFSSQRALALVATVAAGIEVAMAFGQLRLGVPGVPLGLLLGVALAVPGFVAWLRATTKAAISAAAVVAFTGFVQVAVHVVARLDRAI
jgi:hypothetical protein